MEMDGILSLKTYNCTCCGYSAEVIGDKATDQNQTIVDTKVCLNCRTLIEVAVENIIMDDDTYEFSIAPLTKPQPCLNCEEENYVDWDNEQRKCPKCENKMEITKHTMSIVWGNSELRII